MLNRHATKLNTPTTIQRMLSGYQSRQTSASHQPQPVTPIHGFKHWLRQHPTRQIQK
jgi:hypothetical protein